MLFLTVNCSHLRQVIVNLITSRKEDSFNVNSFNSTGKIVYKLYNSRKKVLKKANNEKCISDKEAINLEIGFCYPKNFQESLLRIGSKKYLEI